MSHLQRRIWIASILLAFFFGTLVALPTLLPVQHASSDQAQYTADITALINNYAKAFSTKDYDSIREEVQAPFINFNGAIITTPTVDDVVANYRRGRDSMDKTDYGSSEPEEIRITPLTDKTALVDIHWQVFKKDGSPLHEGGEILMVSKSTGSWKLCGAMHQEPSEFGKTY